MNTKKKVLLVWSRKPENTAVSKISGETGSRWTYKELYKTCMNVGDNACSVIGVLVMVFILVFLLKL